MLKLYVFNSFHRPEFANLKKDVGLRYAAKTAYHGTRNYFMGIFNLALSLSQDERRGP